MKERVRAIIRQNDSILLIHRVKKGREYWVFPGGGVEESDSDRVAALIRECWEELGVNIRVSALFDAQVYGEGDNTQTEYFYFCEIINGMLGTGTGPEFQEGSLGGMYKLEWVPLEKFPSKNIQPESVKEKLHKELRDDHRY